MTISNHSFPRASQLWSGAILGTIAHAIWVASDPTLAYQLSWDGINYSRQDSMGTRGTITFAGDRLVGAFFDENSPRNPLRPGSHYDLHRFLSGMPSDLHPIANEETLQYMLNTYAGAVVPVITTAFWSDGEDVSAAESWQAVVDHGAHLVRTETMETETAIQEWKDNYELTDGQTDLLRSVFERRMSTSAIQLSLEDRDRKLLIANGIEGIDESRELLKAINIIV